MSVAGFLAEHFVEDVVPRPVFFFLVFFGFGFKFLGIELVLGLFSMTGHDHTPFGLAGTACNPSLR